MIIDNVICPEDLQDQPLLTMEQLGIIARTAVEEGDIFVPPIGSFVRTAIALGPQLEELTQYPTVCQLAALITSALVSAFTAGLIKGKKENTQEDKTFIKEEEFDGLLRVFYGDAIATAYLLLYFGVEEEKKRAAVLREEAQLPQGDKGEGGQEC